MTVPPNTLDRDVIFVKDSPYFARGDDATNDTAAIQAAIDANKGGRIYFPAGTYLHAGISLGDSSYNGTVLFGPGILKLKPDAGGSTNGLPAYIGLLIKSCSGIVVDELNFDGNRAAMTHTEFVYNIAIAGADNVLLNNLSMKELRGDGIYIAGSNWNTPPGTIPTNIKILNLSGTNSADDGRNLVSVICCKGLTIANVTSYQVGTGLNDGSGAGTVEPGGIDLEPDLGGELIQDVVIDGANITTAGSSGFAIVGKAQTNDAARDWNVSNVSVKNVRVKRTLYTSAAPIQRCLNVSLDCAAVFTTAHTGVGWQVDIADDVRGALRASHVSIGVNVGVTGEVRDSSIRTEVEDYGLAGLQTGFVTRCDFELKSGLSFAGGFGPFALRFSNNGLTGVSQTDCKYTVHAPYDGVLVRGVRNEPANIVPTFTRCEVQGDLSGFASFPVMWDTASGGATWGAGTFALGSTVNNDSGKTYICVTPGTSSTGPTGTGTNISDGGTARWNYLGTLGASFYPNPFRRNLIGLEGAGANPANGLWQLGEFVRNTSAPGVDCLYGWFRATTGTANVLGTDWYSLQFQIGNGNGRFTASASDGNALLRMGNGSVNSLGFYAASDVGRVFGGGSAPGLVLYSDRQGGSGTGLIQFGANDGVGTSLVFDTSSHWLMASGRASFGKNADDTTNALQVYGGTSFKNSSGTELATVSGTTGAGVFPELDITTPRPTAVNAGPGFVGVLYSGRILDGWVAFSLNYHEWTAAAVTQTISLCTLPGGSRILAVISETDNAYTGLAGTISLKIGLTSGGNELILSHDVKSAPVNKGLLDADLGTSISRAGAVQGGAWVNYSGPGDVFVTMTSGTGNLGNGSVTSMATGASIFYLKVETIE